jgi:hypothetical protein
MKEKISRHVRQITPSIIREMSLRAARYPEAISLGIGEAGLSHPRGRLPRGAR